MSLRDCIKLGRGAVETSQLPCLPLHLTRQQCRLVERDEYELTTDYFQEFIDLKEVAKVLAVDVSPPYITWAHLTRDKQILSWERTKFLDEKSRHHLHSYYSAVQEVLPALPAADLYVVEQRPTRQKQSSESLHLRTQLAIQAMLVALLSHGKEHQPQVVSIKSAAVTQLFHLNVGNERISGQETLNGLFESGAFAIEKGLRTSYLQESSVNREHLCNVLLLAHAFYLLVES